MVETIGVCKGSGKLLCSIRVGSVNLHVSKIGRQLYALVNNRAILTAKSEKEFFSKGLPLVASIIRNVGKRFGQNKVKLHILDAGSKSLVDNALKVLRENLKPAEIQVLQAKPDETPENKFVEASAKIGLADYSKYMGDFSENVNSVSQSANILLKTNLDRSMWGSRDVMAIINDARNNMAMLTPELEKIESLIEHSQAQTKYIQASLNRNTPDMRETVSRVIEGFSTMKSFMSHLAQSSQPLYSIDSVFKSRVGYPATWFFNPSIYMNFLFEHDNLIDHIIKAASVESDVIEPLLIWKVKSTGDKE
jgi:hypothetical protein